MKGKNAELRGGILGPDRAAGEVVGLLPWVDRRGLYPGHFIIRLDWGGLREGGGVGCEQREFCRRGGEGRKAVSWRRWG